VDCLTGSGCRWCKSDSTCADTEHNFACTDDDWLDGDQTACAVLGDLTVAEAAGLGAGVIAAIVIGVAAFVVISAVGSKKGYDIWMKHKENIDGAQSNPMYTDNGRTGNNPFYSTS